MNNYLAIVFSSEKKAHNGLHALWRLDNESTITVHGASIIQRDDAGHINVANRYSNFGRGTAIGVSIGALLGVLAGPIGIVTGMAGAAALSAGAAAAGAGIGALTGGALGITVDSVNEDDRKHLSHKALLKLEEGEFAVLAEVSEDQVEIVDEIMQGLNGVVHRRSKSEAANSLFGPDYYSYFLHPYYYEPPYHY